MFVTKALATVAANLLNEHSSWSGLGNEHGLELAEGFFVIHNDDTGQSKTVLLHAETDLIFKHDWEDTPHSVSGRRICTVNLDGKEYTVRLPKFESFEIDGETIAVQEYVRGEKCCDEVGGWCSHAYTMRRETKCFDTHNGNYRVVGKEVVLFDFEGIDL